MEKYLPCPLSRSHSTTVSVEFPRSLGITLYKAVL